MIALRFELLIINNRNTTAYRYQYQNQWFAYVCLFVCLGTQDKDIIKSSQFKPDIRNLFGINGNRRVQ